MFQKYYDNKPLFVLLFSVISVHTIEKIWIAKFRNEIIIRWFYTNKSNPTRENFAVYTLKLDIRSFFFTGLSEIILLTQFENQYLCELY